MDVGAKAGYYTHKSPKQLLLEWAQTGKRVKPRYRARAAVDGASGHTAKVVLPGAAPGGKDDIVAFTPKGVTCESAAEAEQAAAVVGLHAVAGDRALHRVLPPAYTQLWDDLTETARTRAEKAVKREAAATARAERERRMAAAAVRNAPTRVVMTDDQRDGVAAALAAVREARGGSDVAVDIDEATVAGLASRLRTLGFASSDAAAAATAAASSGHPTEAAALDWACLHIDESRLPAAYGPGAAGRPVGVLVNATGGRADGGVGAIGNASPAPADVDPCVARLAAYGYRVPDVVAALQAARGDEDEAHCRLYGEVSGGGGGAGQDTPTSSSPADAESTAEELEALAAIYGDDLAVTAGVGGATTVTLTLPLDDDGDPLTLRAWLPPSYPTAPPCRVAVQRSTVSAAVLRGLTRALAVEAATSAGAPCVHGLAAAALAALDDEAGLVAGSPRHTHVQTVVTPSGAAAANAADALLHSPRAARQARGGRRPPPPQRVDPAESRRLSDAAAAWATSSDPKIAAMRAARAALPAARQRADVETALARARVVMVAGETGCGKSTQVPQFLFEAAVAAGKAGGVNILVAQPRRVAAVGLASRVAAERGERVGDIVGYSVRLDTKVSARTRITFCTTGVLLRRLLDGGGDGLSRISHVVIDEVHERSVDTDLALLLLQRALAQVRRLETRVVLMSATADAGTFCRYLGGVASLDATSPPSPDTVPVISIPGFTHPVRDLFLEDALEATGTTISRGSRYAKKHAGKEAKGKYTDAASPYSDLTLRSLAAVDESIINYDLVVALVAHILSLEATQGPGALLQGWDGNGAPLAKPTATSPTGAILIFMPGAPEISRAVRAIEASPAVRSAARGGALMIVPLHGGLSPDAQARAFVRPPPGGRKIVVATNVAETSVTIDDVTVVIDTARVKEMTHDPAAGIGRLTEGWVSRAAVKQRRGRAGRVRPGVCFKLCSRRVHDRVLAADTSPEVARAPLEPLCLSLRSALPADVSLAAGAASLITPPAIDALTAAVATLTRMGALDHTATAAETLTPLGRLLARLPMDPRLGKALVYACLLRCAGPALTVAAVLSTGRPIFVAPPDARAPADAARTRLCPTALSAKSDHVAIVEAYNAWDKAAAKGGRGAARALAGDLFLADGALDAARSARADLARSLADMGILPREYVSDVKRWGSAASAVQRAIDRSDANGGDAASSRDPDAASHSARIVKAALCAGFAPAGLLRVEAPAPKFVAGIGGAIEVDPDAASLRFRDERGARVFVHPSSLCFKVARYESGWMVASGIVEVGGKPSARLVTAAPAYAVLLFGGALHVAHAASEIVMDGWARFKAPARIAVLVRELRSAADDALMGVLEKRERGGEDGGGAAVVGDACVVAALHRLLENDGF